MKKNLLLVGLLAVNTLLAQKTENVIIITTDGYRWQEVFGGMDSVLANDKRYNQSDSARLFRKYWSDDQLERRKKLMPFFWNTIAAKGQIYGNRWLGNKVDVSNPYWFSYPGYSEIMCGWVDTAINTNEYKPNPNTTLLEFLNRQEKFKGKVAAFAAWDAFNRILNEQRAGFPVTACWDHFGGSQPNANEQLINAMLDASPHKWPEEAYDMFTHFGAVEYLKNKKPRVLFISYGETDEYAHEREYRSYLDAAHQVDAWIKEIWDFVQSDPQYKDKTTLLFTVDHGRGDIVKSKWSGHGKSVEDSHEIWFAVMGPDIRATGEQKTAGQLYQKQFAQTLAKLLGYTFTAEHPVAEEIQSVLK
jgi:hypothetical protein